MSRVTKPEWRNLDTWEMCGQDKYCKRDCYGDGGCINGCIVPTLYIELAKREDKEQLEEQKNSKYCCYSGRDCQVLPSVEKEIWEQAYLEGRAAAIDEFVEAIEKRQTRQDNYLDPPHLEMKLDITDVLEIAEQIREKKK